MRDEGDRIEAVLYETFRIGRDAAVPLIISHFKCNGRKNFGRAAETLGLVETACRHQRVAFDVYPYHASSTILDPHYIEEAERILITWSDPPSRAAGPRPGGNR